jgi:hypothetical protein
MLVRREGRDREGRAAVFDASDERAPCLLSDRVVAVVDGQDRQGALLPGFGVDGQGHVAGGSFLEGRAHGQLTRFPAGKFDDGVDVCSLIGRGLQQMPAPSAAMPPRYPWDNRQNPNHKFEYDPFQEIYDNIPQQSKSPPRPMPNTEGLPEYWKHAFRQVGRG